MWDNELILRRELTELPSDQLRAMLAAETDREEPDDDLVLDILHILEEREPEPPETARQKAAWKRYRQRIRARKRLRGGTVLKAAAVVLVICLLFVMMPQQARAGSWWQRITGWTDDFFGFFYQEEADFRLEDYTFRTEDPGLQQVYDAAVELGVTIPAVPMWLPEGYELTECTKVETPAKRYIHARFLNEESACILKINLLNAQGGKLYFKDTPDAEKYETSGMAHSVIRNEQTWTVTWTKDNIECAFAIDCDEDVLRKIIDSIYRWRTNE